MANLPTNSDYAHAHRDNLGKGKVVDHRFIALSAQIEEEKAPRTARVIVMLIAFMICFGLVWSANTPIDEVASVNGVIETSSAKNVVQHLEGGTVSGVYVKDGALIEAGAPIVTLDQGALASDRISLVARIQNIEVQIKRWSILLAHRGELEELLAKIQEARDSSEWALLRATVESWIAEQEVLQATRATASARLFRSERELESARQRLDIARQELNRQRALVTRGMLSQQGLIPTLQDFTESQGEVRALMASIGEAEAALREADGRKSEAATRNRRDAKERLTELERDLAGLLQQLAQLDEQLNRLEIKSPITGYVNKLTVTNAGQIVPPGGDIAEIIPSDSALRATVKIPPEEVGHINIGDHAEIKVLSYERFPNAQIAGSIVHMSSDSFVDEQGLTYFEAFVELGELPPFYQSNSAKIVPGMTAIVDIATGSKSLLEYMFKPISKALDSGFQER